MDSKQKQFIISALRRATFKWPARGAAKKAARVPIPGKFFKNGKQKHGYLCAICGQIFAEKDTRLDHKYPVKKVDADTSWEETLERMIPYEDGWQVLCDPCHNEKTREENEKRKQFRQSKKEKK